MKSQAEIAPGDIASNSPEAGESALTAAFKRLSWLDRGKLKLAAKMKAMSGIARDDTKAHPARYPLYAAYMGAFISPLPYMVAAMNPFSVIPFLSGLPFLGPAVIDPLLMIVRFAGNVVTGGLLNSKMTPWTRWAGGRMRDAVQPPALMTAHEKFLEPDYRHAKNLSLFNEPLRLRVRNGALLKDTLRQAWADSHDATKTFCGALCGVFRKKAKAPDPVKAPETAAKPTVP